MQFCVAMCALLLIASMSCFREKKSFICVAIFIHYLENALEMPALAGEVKENSRELQSGLLKTMWKRLPLLFHRKMFVLTKPNIT